MLALLGEAIIIAAFLLFGQEMNTEIFVMDIIVSSVVYLLLFFGVCTPWGEAAERTQRWVGALGISWLFTGLYAVLAVAAMICGALMVWAFQVQIIIHCALLFLLLCGLLASRRAADRVEQVHDQQERHGSHGVGGRPLSSFVQENRDRQSPGE